MGIRNSQDGVSIGDYELLQNLVRVERSEDPISQRPMMRVKHRDRTWFTVQKWSGAGYFVTGGRFDIKGVEVKGWTDALRMLNNLPAAASVSTNPSGVESTPDNTGNHRSELCPNCREKHCRGLMRCQQQTTGR